MYNLTVADCHEYFVNNVLVHNCIAWLLNLWFLTQAKNLHHYGINVRTILINVSNTLAEEQGGYEAINERNRQEEIAKKVDELIELARKEPNYVKAENLINRAKMLSTELTEDIKNRFNLETVLNEIKTNKFKISARPQGQIRLYGTLYDF